MIYSNNVWFMSFFRYVSSHIFSYYWTSELQMLTISSQCFFCLQIQRNVLTPLSLVEIPQRNCLSWTCPPFTSSQANPSLVMVMSLAFICMAQRREIQSTQTSGTEMRGVQHSEFCAERMKVSPNIQSYS